MQAAFVIIIILRACVACWYTYVLLVHTHLQIELDHERDEVRSGAGYPPSESSGSKGHV